MKASKGWNLGLRAAFVLLTVLSAAGQNSPPPLPPLPPTVPRNPNAIPRPTPSVVAAPVTPAPAPTPVPVAPVAQPIQVFPPSTPAPAVTPMDPNAIKWDAETKEYTPKAGEANAPFTFWLTNVSSSDVLVNNVRTSCGCTVAKLPAQPWRIPPGSNGPIEVTLSLAGKSGLIAKGVTVDTSVGIKQLTVRANIPTSPGATGQFAVAGGMMNDAERMKNMQAALADRQVVFKNQDCAKCHSEPAKGKSDGRLLYAAVCSNCHDSLHRAAMVPDLRRLPHPTDADHWRRWIAYGRAGSMMPAFAESEGGPLNEQQINALVDFMVRAFPSRPQPTAVAPRSAAQVKPGVGTVPQPRAN
jgi:mono/diheme cytochrome c family protein